MIQDLLISPNQVQHKSYDLTSFWKFARNKRNVTGSTPKTIYYENTVATDVNKMCDAFSLYFCEEHIVTLKCFNHFLQ